MDSKLTKYQIMLQKKITKQVQEWKSTEVPVSHEELHQFLHTITGTAGTISLIEISKAAADLMNKMSHEQKSWSSIEVAHFLSPVTNLFDANQKNLAVTLSSEFTPSTDQCDKPLLLIVDQDVPYLIYSKEQLENHGFAVVVSPTIEKALSMFYDLSPDCLIVNPFSSEIDGYDFIKQVRETVAFELIPIVVISSSNDKEKRIAAYQKGADDFFLKSLEWDEYVARIDRQVKRRKIVKDTLMKDELTKVYNRKFLKEAYQRISSEHLRHKDNFSMIMIDVDFFKKINDTYGHTAGDHVLIKFADFLRTQLRNQDVVVRYGGEEFLLLLPYTKLKEAEQTACRLLENLSQNVFVYEEHSFFVSFSAGVYEVHSPVSLAEAVRTADRALYAAKENGRGRVETASTQEELNRRLRVAIIDDSEVIRKMLESFFTSLEVENYELEIKTFQDGLSFFADNWHQSNDEYLIILDGVLPKMDGIEVLTKIRKFTDTNQYKILMLTARKAEGDIVRALHLGADDYLTKPFSIRELEARIKVLVQRVK
ncbi:diguanylate cyclase [Fictibacillus nanhaiensis]|uniref:GGDEF domain-containing response regulator n=1 Tax=Fictibacillus nanhaiensis TaxID=742169 RepID=UPI002E1C33B2|nr:diguanylate cyclase [Fictibacillus nanhaiensis]MED1865230.1 diguanylate cyclase [Fictibacillus nanhaiensis]